MIVFQRPDTMDSVEALLIGLGALVTSGMVTWLSYLIAAPGGTYVVATGMFLFGAYSFLKGVISLSIAKPIAGVPILIAVALLIAFLAYESTFTQ